MYMEICKAKAPVKSHFPSHSLSERKAYTNLKYRANQFK